MKKKYTLLLVTALLFGCTLSGYAQDKTITGVVTDASTGKTLPGVNVLVVGTSTGAVTDDKGHYSVNVSSSKETLRFSFIGYKTKTVEVKGRTTIDIALKPTVVSGKQLVVVGYGTQKKEDLTGSIATVQSKDFNKGVSTSVDQLLQGKVAGARIVSNSGAPGGGVSVSIRGASSVNAGTAPLYIIDGMPVQNSNAVNRGGGGFVGSRAGSSPLSYLNPNNIASIEVLKDASATAIYGAEGANGVVIITTKHGTKGHTQVDYNASVGMQTLAHQMDMLTPQQYKRIKNEIIDEGGGSSASKVGSLSNNGKGIDWQSQIFRKSLVQKHNLAISGGNNKTTYRVSLNYLDQNGIIKTSAFHRYGGHLNLTSDISKKFKIGLNLSATYAKNNYAAVGYGVNENAGALYAAINWDPTQPIRNKNGDYYVDPVLTVDNPLAILNGSNSFKNTYRYFGTVHGIYDFLPSLSVKFKIGANVTNQRRDTYINRLTKIGRATGGEANVLHGTLSNYLIQGTAKYKKSFGQNDLKVLLGITRQVFLTDRSSMIAKGFSSDATSTNNMGLGDQSTYGIGSSKFGHKLQSYFGRINYAFRNKYLLKASLRIDGSSRFGPNNKYGYFPSFALGWKLKQEHFLKDVDFLSKMKLRASWGETGNDKISNFLYTTTFSGGAHAIWGDEPVVGISSDRLANQNVRWESTNQLDIGLNFGFMNNRLSGSVDYYRKRTYDMLLNLPIPHSSGYTNQIRNIGSIRNHGIELSLLSQNIRNKNFQWSTNIKFTTLSNKVTNLGGKSEIISGSAGFNNQFFITKVGLPLRSYYGYKIVGVWQKDDDFSGTTDNVQPGDLKFKDVNNDGTINGKDKVVLGNSFPNYSYSFDNTFSYKNVSLNVFFTGEQGISMLNNNLVDTYFPVQFRRNVIAEPYLNRWTPQHPSNKYPSFVSPLDQGKKGINSYSVEDASYLRLKTVQLSYTLPKNVLQNLVSSAKISLTANNIYTFTDYTGLDPAVNSNGNANSRIDYNTYPIPRIYTFSIKLIF